MRSASTTRTQCNEIANITSEKQRLLNPEELCRQCYSIEDMPVQDLQ